jgi:Zn-dependent protease
VFGNSFPLAKLFGSVLRVDVSWFPVSALAAWTMARAVAPERQPELSAAGWWAMGAAASLALFASALVHELAHTWWARRLGVDPGTVTLLPFGGVAELAEPPHARADLAIAAAGPVTSGALALAGWALTLVPGLPGELGLCLALASGAVTAVNLLPAFPLDAGRALRALLWERSGCLRSATRRMARASNAAGLGLAGVGPLLFLASAGLRWLGLWLVVFGLTLAQGARLAYRQLVLRRALAGEPVSRFMKADAAAVLRGTSVRELAALLAKGLTILPVVDHDGRLVGCVSRGQVEDVHEEDRDRVTAGVLAAAGPVCPSIAENADALETLAAMSDRRPRRPVLPVVDPSGCLVGLLSRASLVAVAARALEREI